MKQCKECQIDKEFKLFYKDSKHKDKLKHICKNCYNIRIKEWKIKNYDKTKLYVSKSKEKRKDKDKVLSKNWKLNNKEYILKYRRNWYKNNAYKFLEIGARKRANKKLAAIGFSIFKIEIQEIYKNCPEGYHVDHIIPLNNKIVCGLHVPWNLQYLPAVENLKKSNKL